MGLALILSILSFASVHPASAQDLNVFMTASNEVVGPDDRTTYTLIATNTGATDLTDVSVEVELPGSIRRFSSGGALSCGSFCDPNEVTTWSVGTLAPGEARTVFYQVRITSTATAGTITSTATVSATGASDVSTSQDVVIDDSPLLRLALLTASGPAEAGEALSYTLTYGNVGALSPSGVVLTMVVPSGTSFRAASDGGTESGGVVTWNLGTLGVGSSGQVRLTVSVDASRPDGDVIQAEAVVDPDVSTEPVARSSVATPVRGAEPLRIEYSVSRVAPGPGEPIDMMLTAANTGPVDLTDVSVRMQLPGFIARFSSNEALTCGSFCDPNEKTRWNVGTLGPGETRTAFFRMFVSSGAPQGEVGRSILRGSSSSTGEVTAATVFHVDPTPLLRMSLSPESGPAEAGEPFTYTITFGNIGTSTPTGVFLTAVVPENATFSSATDGGTVSNGVVTWTIGTMGPGNSRQVQFTVTPDAGLSEGTLMRARATLSSGSSTEVVDRAVLVSAVRLPEPLRVEYDVSQTAVSSGRSVDVILTAANTGPVDLTDVSVRIQLPEFINRFSAGADLTCGSFCDASEVTRWVIGTLAPGESRAVFFRIFPRSTAPQGEVMRSLLTARSSSTDEVSAAADFHIDPSPVLQLSLISESGPVVPGEEITYFLTFGNIGSSAVTPTLTMQVPEGTTFVSATGGGTASGETVTWNPGTLGPESSRQVRLTVQADDALADGEMIRARAAIDPGTATEVAGRSSTTMSVRDGVPLRIEYAVSQTALGQGESTDIMLTATNTSTVDLTDVSALLRLPGGISRFGSGGHLTCGSFCDPNERTRWNVGTLAAGESRTRFFRVRVPSGTEEGRILRSMLTGTSSSTAQVTAALNLQVDSAPDLKLSLDATPGPVPAGEELVYTLSAGNASGQNVSGVVMRMPIPEGTRFLTTSSTDGGEFQSGTLQNGFVVWDIGDILSAGRAGQATVTVQVDGTIPSGDLVTAEAEIFSDNQNRLTVRSTAVTAVRAAPVLNLTYATNRAYVNPASSTQNTVRYTLTATNTGSVDLTDAEARIKLPRFISRFDSNGDLTCGSFCDPDDWTRWMIGTLSPGASQSITFEPTAQSSAPSGAFLQMLLYGAASGSREMILEGDVLIAAQDAPLPVEWTRLDAVLLGDAVELTWATASEQGNAGFEVERSTNAQHFERIGFQPGRGTTAEPQRYRFVDRDVPFAETVFYRLRQVDVDGAFEYSPMMDVSLTPTRFTLLPTAPHPIRGATRLRYQLPKSETVSLHMYDLLGRRVATLVDGKQAAGNHEVMLNGTHLAPGTYFLRLRAGNALQTRQVHVVR